MDRELKQKSLALVRAEGWPLQRKMSVIHHVEKYLFRALEEFLNAMRSELKSRLLE